jgi:hypothetical protein
MWNLTLWKSCWNFKIFTKLVSSLANNTQLNKNINLLSDKKWSICSLWNLHKNCILQTILHNQLSVPDKCCKYKFQKMFSQYIIPSKIAFILVGLINILIIREVLKTKLKGNCSNTVLQLNYQSMTEIRANNS